MKIDPMEHTGLIHHILNTQTWLYGSKSSWTYDDAYQEAFMALMEALQTYDSTQGTVATYCLQRIKWGLFRAYQEQNGLIRKPAGIYEIRSQYRKLQLEYFRKYNEEADIKYIALQMRMTVPELKGFLDLFAPPSSLDAPIKGTDDITLADTIQDERDDYTDVEYRLNLAQLRKDLQRMMDEKLTAIDQQLIKEYYAWNGGDQPTVKELARNFNYSVALTNRKLKKALAEFRKYRRELAKNYPDIVMTQIYNQDEKHLPDLRKMKSEILAIYLSIGDLIHVNTNIGTVMEIDYSSSRFKIARGAETYIFNFRDVKDMEMQGRKISRIII